MLIDFEVQRSTRRCAATDRALEPGDECFTVLESAGAEIVRKDFCREAWNGPSEGAIGWWKWRVPETAAKKIKLAPNDVLLELYDRLANEQEQDDMRYVLTLLLVRRRVFRLEMLEDAFESRGTSMDVLHVYCPKREANYEVAAVIPSEERIEKIQRQLSELLVAGAE